MDGSSATTADDCAGALIAAWVTRFRVPAAITSDRGPQFCGAIWHAFCATIGVQHITTAAYHPEGMAWWSACTAASRTCSERIAAGWTGPTTCPGFFSRCVAPPGRKTASHQPRRSMAHRYPCQRTGGVGLAPAPGSGLTKKCFIFGSRSATLNFS